MLLGILSDLHLGYTRGHKTLPNGTNVRENDVYEAASKAVYNLLLEGVDSIVDLGDIAHTPSPRKRTLLKLIDLINDADIDWYSVNGNHTLQRTSSDTHLYDFINWACPRFHGAYAGPLFVPRIGAYLIPYDAPERVAEALAAVPSEARLVAGHWACDDADWPGEHIDRTLLPKNIPTFLGHWHTRHLNNQKGYHNPFRDPIYVGATERFAWGEATNPTGVATYDTETKALRFINHKVRPWVDIVATPEDYLEDGHYEQTEDAIVRVRITATPEQYHSLDLVSVRKKLASALEFQILRAGSEEVNYSTDRSTTDFSIEDNWRDQVKRARIPKGLKREDVERVGLEALS